MKTCCLAAIPDAGLNPIKRSVLLFEDVYVFRADGSLAEYDGEIAATIEYLQERKALTDLLTISPIGDYVLDDPVSEARSEAAFRQAYEETRLAWGRDIDESNASVFIRDHAVRRYAPLLSQKLGVGVVPILEGPYGVPVGPSSSEVALRVVLDSLPVPSETCPWDEIIDYKGERGNELWGLRRFLRSLSEKHYTEAELRDEIEWSLYQYQSAMEIHRLKTTPTALELILLPPVEIIENLVKFNWSKILKGAVSLSRRKIRLLEAEMHAPGRECAYIFHAQERFRN